MPGRGANIPAWTFTESPQEAVMYRSSFASALAMAALAAILLPSPLHAQITFQRTYGVGQGKSVQQTADGGFVIVGSTWNSGTHSDDVYLIKTYSNGDSAWTRTFGGDSDDYGLAVQQTDDGGYIVAGYTSSFGAGLTDVYLVKTNASGDTDWTRTYGCAGYDGGYSVQQTSDGGYIISGITQVRSLTSDLYLIKTDSRGDTLWTKAYGAGEYFEVGEAVRQTADGFIAAGSVCTWLGETSHVYLIKTGVDGDSLWARAYRYPVTDWGHSVQETADGGYLIAGVADFGGTTWWDVYLIRTDVAGDTLWTRTYGSTGDDGGSSISLTADGGCVIVGYTDSYGAGGSDVYLVRTDAVGDTLWTRTYGDSDNEDGWSIQQTADSGYVMAGASDGRLYLIKTDGEGRIAVAEPKASPTRAPALSLSCEPNPFAGTTTIHLTPFASRHSPIALRIYDAQGRRVRTFTVNRTPCTVWDGTGDSGQPLPSGAYFVRVDDGNEHATTRIVLQQ
jgi:hypothetical protein